VNALWDLWARVERKPLWQIIAELTPEQIVSAVDWRWITDYLTPEEALTMLRSKADTRHERIAQLRANGYPAYTTSAGWLGFSDDEMVRLCQEARAAGFRHFKVKVGVSLSDDQRRLALIRRAAGADAVLMVDANQRWDVPTAITYMAQLAEFHPLFIEEPTSPDDAVGHARIRAALRANGSGIKVATGEAVQNRVIFKQMLQLEALDFLQIDACRVGGVNELLAILLMAAKARVPIWPHAGGVGLCELVQHLAIADYVAISGSLNVCEYVVMPVLTVAAKCALSFASVRVGLRVSAVVLFCCVSACVCAGSSARAFRISDENRQRRIRAAAGRCGRILRAN
jgi:L-fuconate dehydratase